MTASALQVVPELLEEARRHFRRSMPPSATAQEVLASRGEHFAAALRFALDHPEALRRLQTATGRLRGAGPLDGWLSRLLDGAIALAGADFADVHVLDPATWTLRMVAHAGFGDEVVAHFGVVEDDGTSCGRAVRSGRQVVIPDVARDASFAPHRATAAQAGFRSVQSTPLRDYAGRMVGVFSTHWRRRHVPSVDDLELLSLYADHAGEQLARLLTPEGPDNPPEPEVGVIARAMLAALLDPPEPAHEQSHPQGDAGVERLAVVADTVVSDLFAVGLLLDGASSLASDDAVVDRISRASRSVERVIGLVRDLLVTYADGDQPADRPPDRPPG